MKYDVPYLAGLALAPKDGKARVLELGLQEIPDNKTEYVNQVLLAMQEQGYQIRSVSFLSTAGREIKAFVLYA